MSDNHDEILSSHAIDAFVHRLARTCTIDTLHTHTHAACVCVNPHGNQRSGLINCSNGRTSRSIMRVNSLLDFNEVTK